MLQHSARMRRVIMASSRLLQFLVTFYPLRPASAAYEGFFCRSKLDGSAAGAVAAQSASFCSDIGPSTVFCGKESR